MKKVFSFLIVAVLMWSTPGSSGEKKKPKKIKPQHTLFVFSDPPLSDIYVNGVKQEAPTPAVIRVPANAQPVIEIKKDGHQPYKKTITTEGSGSKFSATLRKSTSKSTRKKNENQPAIRPTKQSVD